MPNRPIAEHPSDLALTRAVLEGDEAAFDEVFDRYLAPVGAFARRARTGDAAARVLAREILQSVFGNLHGYTGRSPLDAWVLALARRVTRARVGRSSASAAA